MYKWNAPGFCEYIFFFFKAEIRCFILKNTFWNLVWKTLLLVLNCDGWGASSGFLSGVCGNNKTVASGNHSWCELGERISFVSFRPLMFSVSLHITAAHSQSLSEQKCWSVCGQSRFNKMSFHFCWIRSSVNLLFSVIQKKIMKNHETMSALLIPWLTIEICFRTKYQKNCRVQFPTHINSFLFTPLQICGFSCARL